MVFEFLLLEPPGSRNNRLINEESQARLLNFFSILPVDDDSNEEPACSTIKPPHTTNRIEKWFMKMPDLSGYSNEWRKNFSERPTWVDSELSLHQILQGKASGNKLPLYSRAIIQRCLNRAGNFVQRYALSVILLMFILFGFCCYGLKYVHIETDIVKLWVSENGRLNDELNYFSHIQKSLQNNSHDYDPKHFTDKGKDPKLLQIPEDEVASTVYQVLIQTADHASGNSNLLTKDGLLQHVKLITEIKNLRVQKFGSNWTLDDICFKPGGLDIDSNSVAWSFKPTLERLIPCIWITPIDCFFEGAKPLGPSPPIDTSEMMGGLLRLAFGNDIPKLATWSNINPEKIVSEIYKNFDLGTMKNFFLRTGIGQGYLNRQCINPLDPECPKFSPNYFSKACESLQFFKKEIPITKGKNLSQVLGTFIQPGDSSDAPEPSLADILGSFFLTTSGSGTAKNKTESEIECEKYRSAYLRWMDANIDLVKDLFPIELLPKYPDYGKVMSSGCNGFARTVMNWPVDMILGGIHDYFNGTIEAEALQSIILVSNPTDIYTRFKESSELENRLMSLNATNNFDNTSTIGADAWSPLVAKEVIIEWQRKFTDFIYTHKLNLELDGRAKENRLVHPLATVSISDILSEYCDFNFGVIFAGYFLMLVYTLYSQLRTDGCCLLSIDSSIGLALAGVLIITFASISGLGLATWLGIEFNAATTQVVPFLTLGIGVDNMFLLLHNYPHISASVKKDEIGFLMKSTGMSILMTSTNNILSFLAGTCLPIPALRSFCTQCSILLTFNLIAIMTVFPAIIALDLKRKKSGRRDLCCCIFSEEQTKQIAYDSPYGFATKISDSILVPAQELLQKQEVNYHGLISVSRGKDDDDEEMDDVQPYSLRNFLRNYYIPFIGHGLTKFFVVFACLMIFVGAIFAMRDSTIGLELSDVLPENTPPAAFLKARDKYFSFYPMFIVLRGEGINFPDHQHLIDSLRHEIGRSKYVVKLKNGEPSERYWLQLFRDWLQGLQDKLDEAERLGILENYDYNNFTKTPDLDIAYSLTCSAGNDYNCSRVGNVKMIDSTGTINSDGFYNYIYGWHEYESMFYSVSQASFFPKLNKLKQGNETRRYRYFIPPAPKPLFSRIPFFLTGLKNTTVIVKMIKEIRMVCNKYTELGLNNYPEGVAFIFWEQYLDLNMNLMKAIAVISFSVFCVISILLFNPWAACCVLVILVIMIVELAGFLGFCQIKFNPVSAVTLITAVGIGVEFTVHVVFSFLTALGTRNERMAASIDQVFVPVIHGALSTLLGILMLGFSKFDFVFNYFFIVLTALILIGLVNGLVLLPVLLSLVGPNCEIRLKGGGNRLHLPHQSHKRQNQFTKFHSSSL